MIKKKIVIIGGGPNAVYALEILLKKILKNSYRNIYKITIFDENGYFGYGNTHSKFLSKDILLNRIAGQISLGSYPFIKFKKNLRKFDYNFMEWAKKSKLDIKPTDWPSRAILGKAFEDKFYDLLLLFSKYTSIRIELVFKKVRKISKKKNKYSLITKYKDYKFDYLLVCTGNYISNSYHPTNTTYIKSTTLGKQLVKLSNNTSCDYAYNYLERLPKNNFWKGIKNSSVAIIGTGTSSLDVIRLLYKNKNNIYPISRSFLYPFARPLNQKISNPKKLEHHPIVLNNNIIYKLRKELNNSKNLNRLDFESFIHPFIKAEFYLVYFRSFLKKNKYLSFKKKIQIKISKKINNNKIINNLDLEKLIDNEIIYLFNENKINIKFYKSNWFSNKIIIDSILKRKIPFYDLFVDPLLLYKNEKVFLKKYISFMEWDINEAKKGNLNSAYKKACDGVWRDIRPQFTKLFDDCTNLKVYNYFLKKILPIHNKLCDGPSLKLIIFIKNLIKKKIIKYKFLNNYEFKNINKNLYICNNKFKQKLDYIFCAIADLYKESYEGDKFINSMINEKIVSLNSQKIMNKKYSVGLNLNENQHPINHNGKISKNITFIGPASEGKKFFHHTLARPDKKQPNLIDLTNWVKSIGIS